MDVNKAMENKTKYKGWIPLDEIIGSCNMCKHNKACDSIRTHAASCVKQEYGFRCPVLVKATQQEVEIYDAKKLSQIKKNCTLPTL